jgi:hypothetical protein
MKSKNPVNFQGIIHRKENCKKQKQNKNQAMCDRSSKKLFIHTTNKNKNKKTKQTKQNTLTTILHPKKTIERRLCLLGIVLIFCLCISEKFNQVSFKCHPLKDHLLPFKEQKTEKNLVKLSRL